MFRSIFLILSGNVFRAVILMVRNIIIARLISVADYGIASTFMLAMSIVEMMSALGLQQQMVQAKNGNDPHLQAALQGFQVMRACSNSIILFLLGAPLAKFFGHPDLAWAYQMVALIPMMNGLMHFDQHRMSRQMNYWPSFIISVAPALVSVAIVWPIYKMVGDFRVMLFALIAQTFLQTMATHLVAKRAYKLSFDREIISSSLRFGWPLLLNGILMFAIFNGDRMIVGRELGMKELGLFSMAFSLSLTPTLVIARSVMNFFLPQLSATAEDSDKFQHLSSATFEAHLFFGNALIVGIALFGGPFLHFTLGEKYVAAIPLLTWLAMMQGLRIFKGGSSTVALAKAHTANAMLGNITRVAALPVAWYVLVRGGSLIEMVWIGLAAEFAGFALGLWLALYRLNLSSRPLWPTLAMSAILFVVAGMHAQAQYHSTGWMPDLRSGAALVILLALSVLAMRDLRIYVAKRQLARHVE
ncbi:MAG: oligosaccharide flippase family protein [Cypionkella sp.]|jgi:O-antigen/teichoic acid export membrane protein